MQFSNLPPVVKNLLIINVLLVFLASVYYSHNFSDPGFDPVSSLFGVYYFNSPNFRVWANNYLYVCAWWLAAYNIQYVCVISIWAQL